MLSNCSKLSNFRRINRFALDVATARQFVVWRSSLDQRIEDSRRLFVCAKPIICALRRNFHQLEVGHWLNRPKAEFPHRDFVPASSIRCQDISFRQSSKTPLTLRVPATIKLGSSSDISASVRCRIRSYAPAPTGCVCVT